MIKKVKRGDIFLADMNPAIGSEQGGIRPVLIIQNNMGNKHSPTTMVACLTTKRNSKKHLSTHYLLPYIKGLKEPSMVLFEQIFTIDKSRLIKKVARVPSAYMNTMTRNINSSLSLNHKRKVKTTNLHNGNDKKKQLYYERRR